MHKSDCVIFPAESGPVVYPRRGVGTVTQPGPRPPLPSPRARSSPAVGPRKPRLIPVPGRALAASSVPVLSGRVHGHLGSKTPPQRGPITASERGPAPPASATAARPVTGFCFQHTLSHSAVRSDFAHLFIYCLSLPNRNRRLYSVSRGAPPQPPRHQGLHLTVPRTLHRSV